MCILLVEDEQTVREFLEEALIDEGYDTCTAASGDQAFRLIESPPKVLRLLLTDIDLPGKCNGISLAELTHRHYPSLPVLYITGRPDKVAALTSVEALLPKPFSLQKLVETVRHLLALRHPPFGIDAAPGTSE